MLGEAAQKEGDLKAAVHHFAAVLPAAAPAWQADRLSAFLEAVQLAALQQVHLVLPGTISGRGSIGSECNNYWAVCHQFSHQCGSGFAA